MLSRPGTVSKILWHFTGGPKWNEAEKRQEKELKPTQTAYEYLIKIIESKELRIGQFKEVVKAPIELPPMTPSRKPPPPEYLILQSAPVACLADIPVIHLGYHAKRYGKIAIGFHRRSVIKQGFSPVFYQPEDSDVLDAILRVSRGIRFSYPEATMSDLIRKRTSSRDRNSHDAHHDDDLDPGEMSLEELELRSIKDLLKVSDKALSEVFAYIKTFTIKEFETIYCEREWRSTKPFKFDHADIAMIAVPRSGGFFQRLINWLEASKIPRAIPIVPWEDLKWSIESPIGARPL